MNVGQAFNEYIEQVKTLDTKGKRKEVLSSIKELIAVFQTFAERDEIELTPLINREINDLDQGNETEDDFLEAMLVYLEIAKNNIGEYLDHKNI